jgi:DNA ligase 1
MTDTSTPWTLIQQLAATPSRNAKIDIVRDAALADCHEFFLGLRWALDPLCTFGVKQVPRHGGPDGQGLPWQSFEFLLQQLSQRQLTGNQARQAIELCLSAATADQWNWWYRRILVKELDCGLSEKTVNPVVQAQRPEWAVPVFECALAQDGSEQIDRLQGQRLLEVKLDGVRLLTVMWPDGRVQQFSRNGRELTNFAQITAQLAQVAHTLEQPWVLDGEIVSSSFQDLMTQVHRKSNVDTSDAVLYLFDCVPLCEFQRGQSTQTQSQRSQWLREWRAVHQAQLLNVQVLEQQLVDFSTEQGRLKFDQINRQAIQEGYEGLMIKSPNALYQCRRTAHWLKVKPSITVDLTVTAVEIGTGRNSTRLGALVCQGQDQDRDITVNVGSGFSDDQRRQFWDQQDQLLGHVAEIRADAVTQNQDGSYSLRFPRFVRFRSIELGEKI